MVGQRIECQISGVNSHWLLLLPHKRQVTVFRFPQKRPCFLCEYQAKRIPWYPIYQGELISAFLNVRQRSQGATLVATRRHIQAFSEMTTPEADEMMHVLRSVGRGIMDAFTADGLHTFTNAGMLAGQSEPHLHFQLIPRFSGIAYSFDPSAEFSLIKRDEAVGLANRIRDCVERHRSRTIELDAALIRA